VVTDFESLYFIERST